MLLCIMVKGYTPDASNSGNSTFTDVVVAVGGAVDPLDEGVVVAYVLKYFRGCAWCYSQPQGYDTYDLTDVMIVGKNVMDPDASLTVPQAKAIIAQHGCAASGRIPVIIF